MIVSRLGNTAGAVHTAPKAKAPPAARPSAAPALFDANGDGVIENWSVLHGGDNFATLDPAPAGSQPAPTHHVATPSPSSPRRLSSASHSAPGSTPAAIHHAQDAYQRDGLADTAAAALTPNAAISPVAAQPAAIQVAASTQQPVATPPPVSQDAPMAHLPSIG
jgi:hypothetical protein